MRALGVAGLVLSLVACSPGSPRAAERVPAPPAPGSGPQLRFEPADERDVASQVRALVSQARAEGRTPLVYVGASWCEPCQHFHAAALAGALDSQLPRLLLLEFDRDRDGERLDAAGYGSRMFPLFVVPNAEGGASEARIEGSIHGPTSPSEIAPRLRGILPPRAAAGAGPSRD